MGGASFVGRVVSNRMQKTVVVAVDYLVWRPKLKVHQKRTAKHFAHDEGQECNIGDMVRIRWIPRRSKHKHYTVEERLHKVDVLTPEAAAKGAVQAHAGMSQAALAEAQLAQAKMRLQTLQQELAQLRAEHGQQDASAALMQQDSGGGGDGAGQRRGGSRGSGGSSGAAGSSSLGSQQPVSSSSKGVLS